MNDVESVLQLRHIQAAEEDYLEMRRRVKHMPRRRAAPPWALPSEVLLMLLWPRRVRVRATTGLGMAPLPTPHRWQAALQRVLRDVHRAGRVPQQAHRSLGVTLDKAMADLVFEVLGLFMLFAAGGQVGIGCCTSDMRTGDARPTGRMGSSRRGAGRTRWW